MTGVACIYQIQKTTLTQDLQFTKVVQVVGAGL